MQFQVPQFIEVEDKIFGPLTVKQFVYLAGGVGLSFIIYNILPFFLAIIFIGGTMAFSLALAFYKINNKPFIFTLEAAVRYVLSSKLYIWKKEERKPVSSRKGEETKAAAESLLSVPRLSESRLRDLAWSLDVKESENPVSK